MVLHAVLKDFTGFLSQNRVSSSAFEKLSADRRVTIQNKCMNFQHSQGRRAHLRSFKVAHFTKNPRLSRLPDLTTVFDLFPFFAYVNNEIRGQERIHQMS
jgi:hypothetical protein